MTNPPPTGESGSRPETRDCFEQDLLEARATLSRIAAMPKDRSIVVDGKQFSVSAEMTAHALRALVKKDLQYQLFLEGITDRLIQHRGGESIHITDGMRFYTVPPAGFGSSPALLPDNQDGEPRTMEELRASLPTPEQDAESYARWIVENRTLHDAIYHLAEAYLRAASSPSSLGSPATTNELLGNPKLVVQSGSPPELKKLLRTLVRVSQHIGAEFYKKGVPLPKLEAGEDALSISTAQAPVESYVASLEEERQKWEEIARTNFSDYQLANDEIRRISQSRVPEEKK